MWSDNQPDVGRAAQWWKLNVSRFIPTFVPNFSSGMRFIPKVSLLRLILLVFSMLVVWWYVAAINQIDRSATEVIAMSKVSFEVGAGQEVVLGRRDLGQAKGTSSAQHNHLNFFDNGGELNLQKVADRKRLDLKFIPGERSVYSDRYPIPQEGQGIVEVMIGKKVLRIERTGWDEITATIDGKQGPVNAIFRGNGAVEVDNKKLDVWCNSNPSLFEHFEQKIVWPFKRLSRILSESKFIPNMLRDSNARRIINFGGDTNCRLASNAALIALPDVHEELELGIRRFFDDGKIRYYVHQIAIPPNAPVTYQTKFSGQRNNVQTQYDQLRWKVHTSGKVAAHHVTGFTAGFTDYDITASTLVQNSDQNAGGNSWQISLKPTRRVAYFSYVECRDYVGQWTSKDMLKAEQDSLLSCPGPSRSENRSFKFEHKIIGSPIERLFAFGRIDFLNANKSGEPMKSSGAFKFGEKLAYTALTSVTLILVLLILARPREFGFWRGNVRVLILTTVFVIQCFQLSVLWADWWPSEITPQWLFYSSAIMLALGCIAAWLDDDGGWLSQVLTIVIFALMTVGAITLFSLSAGGDTADLERYFIKHKAFLFDNVTAMWIIVCLSSGVRIRTILGRSIIYTDRWYSPFKLVPSVLLLIFLMWLFIGTQEGLLGFQPVELGKFIVVLGVGAILARLALNLRLSSGLRTRGTTIGIMILIFLISLLVVPVVKSDVSPIIVVCGCLFALAIFEIVSIARRVRREREADQAEINALPTAPLPPKSQGMGRSLKFVPLLVLTCIALMLASAYWVTDRYVTPKNFSIFSCPSDQVAASKEALGQGRRLLIERFMGWADMRYDRVVMDRASDCTHANLNQVTLSDIDISHQGLRSRAAIAHAPCGLSPTFHVGPVNLAGHLLGGLFPSELMPCPRESKVLPTINCSERSLVYPVVPNCIPVVESDFIGAFVIVKHGLSAGFLLVSTQFFFIVVGLFIYSSLKSKLVREPLVRGAHDILATSAIGVTLLFAIQWTLAWGNTFVLLPIMGQPMTWISAATSHHLFMALPASLLLLIAARTSKLRHNTIPFGQHP